MENEVKVLDRKLFWKTVVRSLALQGAFNYERMQAIGWCFALLPSLRRIYKDKEDMAAALQRHVTFFNTSPQFVTFIMGLVVAMEEENAKVGKDEESNADAIGAIKAALMGPLAGIGDSFFWGTIRIIGAGIGTGLAVKGNILGAILFLLIYNVPHYILRIGGLKIGYSSGMAFMQKVYAQGLFEKLTAAAKLLGTFVVGAMIATMVKLQTPVVLKFNGTKTVLQDMFNGILPAMLPLGLTFLVYWMVKKGYKVTYIMLGLMVFGILGVLIGVL
jgi:mannose/fructose/sorbose-specific phosphotransferase system IID component